MELARGRSTAIGDLISKLKYLELDKALHEEGAAPCAALLERARRHQQVGEWESCHNVALKAKEYAWERLHRYVLVRQEFSSSITIARSKK